MNSRIIGRPGGVRLALLVLGDVGTLCLARPDLPRLLGIAAHPNAALTRFGTDRVIASGVGAGLWLAAAWVALGLLAAVGARAPGLTGRACSAVADVALPAAVRRVVIGAVGLGLLAGPTGSAFAAPAHPGRAMIASSSAARSSDPTPGPAWPTSTPPTSTPPSSTPPMTPSAPPVHGPTRQNPTQHGPAQHGPAQHGRLQHGDGSTRPADVVRVRPGDSLWLIAAHRLAGAATPHRTAEYWPAVYAANRSVVGPDPGLVSPGQLLHLPDPGSS